LAVAVPEVLLPVPPAAPLQLPWPDWAAVLSTLKLESSMTTTWDPSVLVTCTSYAAALFELSASVVALVTLPPGTAVSAAADAEDRVLPVSAVSPELVDVEEFVEEFVEWRWAWEWRWRFAASAGTAPLKASTATVATLAKDLTMPVFMKLSLL
jgi:hypothetical protein